MVYFNFLVAISVFGRNRIPLASSGWVRSNIILLHSPLILSSELSTNMATSKIFLEKNSGAVVQTNGSCLYVLWILLRYLDLKRLTCIFFFLLGD